MISFLGVLGHFNTLRGTCTLSVKVIESLLKHCVKSGIECLLKHYVKSVFFVMLVCIICCIIIYV